MHISGKHCPLNDYILQIYGFNPRNEKKRGGQGSELTRGEDRRRGQTSNLQVWRQRQLRALEAKEKRKMTTITLF